MVSLLGKEVKKHATATGFVVKFLKTQRKHG